MPFRGLAVGHRDPEVHRRGAARVAKAGAREDVEQDRPLPRIALASALDVLFAVPGDHRGPLDELLRRRADVRPVAAESVDQRLVPCDEPAAEACHRRPLGERVERDDVRPVLELQHGWRWLVEPELAVRLVGSEDEAMPTC